MNTVHFESNSYEWETPQELFNMLNAEFNFTLDPCATNENAKCLKFYTKIQDGLAQDWTGETVFCNPPYNRKQDLWIKKCLEHGLAGYTAVMLLPARTDTKRFHNYILNKAAEIRFIQGRLKFNGAMNNAPFPSMIIIFNRS